MGRLYDKKDLSFNLAYWDRREQQMHADIANGVLEPSFLDEIITETRDHKDPCHRGCGCKSYRVREGFDLERKRERMKLLRTGQLLSDLKCAQNNFDSCPHCHLEADHKRGKSKIVECDIHSPALKKAKSAVYWAGERNLAERNARGQIREDGVATAQEALEGLPQVSTGEELNRWESWYQRDKAEGVWTEETARLEECPFSYKGWLEMLFCNEEMTQSEYLEEMERVRKQERELEEASLQWAGGTLRNGAVKRAGNRAITFRRDTRFNSAVA